VSRQSTAGPRGGLPLFPLRKATATASPLRRSTSGVIRDADDNAAPTQCSTWPPFSPLPGVIVYGGGGFPPGRASTAVASTRPRTSRLLADWLTVFLRALAKCTGLESNSPIPDFHLSTVGWRPMDGNAPRYYRILIPRGGGSRSLRSSEKRFEAKSAGRRCPSMRWQPATTEESGWIACAFASSRLLRVAGPFPRTVH